MSDALAAREAEYKDRFANPFVAAGLGYIDAVIMPHGTRRRLIKALRPGTLAEADFTSILDRADGNPFFVEELVGATWATGGPS